MAQTKAARAKAEAAPPAPQVWQVADEVLYAPGIEAMPVRVHNPGDRVLTEIAEQYGWMGKCHPLLPEDQGEEPEDSEQAAATPAGGDDEGVSADAG